jgi:hypothetical protein
MYTIVEKTSDGAVKAAGGALAAVVLTGGSAAATVDLYDNPSAASGSKLITLKCAANTSVTFCPAFPVVASIGIYADLTGTGAQVFVAYM